MKVYRADAAGKATGDPVATSGNGATSGVLGYEEAAVLDPVGSYVARGQKRTFDLRGDCKVRR